MKINEKHHYLVEKYIDNELNKEEKKIFEYEKENNKEFAEYLETRLELRANIKEVFEYEDYREQLKNTITTHKENKKKRKKKSGRVIKIVTTLSIAANFLLLLAINGGMFTKTEYKTKYKIVEVGPSRSFSEMKDIIYDIVEKYKVNKESEQSVEELIQTLNLYNQQIEEINDKIAIKFFDTNKFKDAITYFKKASELNPDEGRYYYDIANCYYHINEFDSTVIYLEKAKEKDYEFSSPVILEEDDFYDMKEHPDFIKFLETL